LLAIPPGTSAQSPLPDGPGKKLVELVCSKCHSTDRIASRRLTKAEWREEVTEMLQEEDDVTEAEKDEIVEYLAKSFPAKAELNNGMRRSSSAAWKSTSRTIAKRGKSQRCPNRPT
jgi:CO dehydrogenase/acetyl-CoA synthase alpha subunit